MQIAASLATDADRLATERLTLRGLLAASPLCDFAQFAGHFEQMVRSFWTERYGDEEDDFLSKIVA